MSSHCHKVERLSSHCSARQMGFGAKFAFAVLANQSTGLDPDGAAAVRSLPRLCAMVEDSQSAEI
jgi:hypothetical protein